MKQSSSNRVDNRFHVICPSRLDDTAGPRVKKSSGARLFSCGIFFRAISARCPELTPLTARLRLPFDNLQVWEVGKAVRIGHGPATVIGETP